MATAPVQVEEAVQAATTAENPNKIIADPAANNPALIEKIKDLAKYVIGLDKWVRRQEVIEARRQRFYWRGDQFIYWKNDSIGFMIASSGSSIATGDSSLEVSRYTDVYNIYTPYGESILSTLIQTPPGVNWQPADPTEPKDITGFQTAEKYQQKIEIDNNRKDLQSDVSRLFYTDGRCILLTEQEGDMQRITAQGVLESKVVPITAKRAEDLIAVVISDEIDIYKAKDEYRDYSPEKIQEGAASLGESAYERIARLGTLQGTRMLMQAGDAFKHMVTRHKVFIRTCVFEKLTNDDPLKETLKTTYPDGLFAIFCGEAYCGSQSVSLDDHVKIGFPTPGDGMSRPSLGKRMVPLQDVFNDELNLWHEAHDYCVPTLFMYSETGDIDAIREQISQPGNVIPFSSLPPGASSAAEAFYAAVLEAVPQTLPSLVSFIQGPLAQFISGAFPALFGGDTKDNDTAKGIAIQRDQAMGRMGIPWSAIQSLFSGAYEQAVKLAVRNSPEDARFNYSFKDKAGNLVAEELNISDLRNGHFSCSPNADSSFPESVSSKKATAQMIMTAAERNPILAEIMSQPQNQELFHEWVGLPELIVPSAQAAVKQLIEIYQLLNEKPIPPSPDELVQAGMADPQLAQAMIMWTRTAEQAQANGSTPPPPPIPEQMMKPSIQVDPQFDFHQYEYQAVMDWLSSESKRKEEAKGNVAGIQNVRLHGLQHKALIPPPMPTPIGPEAAKPKIKEHQEKGTTEESSKVGQQ